MVKTLAAQVRRPNTTAITTTTNNFSGRMVGVVLVLIMLSFFGSVYLRGGIWMIGGTDMCSTVVKKNGLNNTTANTSSNTTQHPVVLQTHTDDHTTNTTREMAHVLFSLSGNSSGFLHEFEVGLKSVLLNAPLEHDLTIHVMADETAHGALEAVFHRIQIQNDWWIMRNPVEIRVWCVQDHVKQAWKKHVVAFKKKIIGQERYSDAGHTVGAWFRLFANEILPSTVEHVIYMDTDAVFMSNFGPLWVLRDSTKVFQWGENMCSGFILLNVGQIDKLWDLASRAELTQEEKNKLNNLADQDVLRAVNTSFPEFVGVLPTQWDFSIADGIWAHGNTITEYRPKVGMMHFNGGGSTPEPYFEAHKWATNPENQGTFGLVQYYAHIPWTWAAHIAESFVRKNENTGGRSSGGAGFPITVTRPSCAE